MNPMGLTWASTQGAAAGAGLRITYISILFRAGMEIPTLCRLSVKPVIPQLLEEQYQQLKAAIDQRKV